MKKLLIRYNHPVDIYHPHDEVEGFSLGESKLLSLSEGEELLQKHPKSFLLLQEVELDKEEPAIEDRSLMPSKPQKPRKRSRKKPSIDTRKEEE
jgi:hypothetical protein